MIRTSLTSLQWPHSPLSTNTCWSAFSRNAAKADPTSIFNSPVAIPMLVEIELDCLNETHSVLSPACSSKRESKFCCQEETLIPWVNEVNRTRRGPPFRSCRAPWLNRLKALRGPGESYSDVIVRLARGRLLEAIERGEAERGARRDCGGHVSRWPIFRL